MRDSPASRGSRARWPVRKVRLGAEPLDDLAGTTPDERLAMVAELSLMAYRLAGRLGPELPRAAWPVRKTTLTEADGSSR